MTTLRAARAAAAPLGAGLTAGLLVLSLGSPAGAAVRVAEDPVGDTAGHAHGTGDVTKLRIKHAPRALRMIAFHAEDSRLSDVQAFIIDTDADAAGPEYTLGTGIGEGGSWHLYRADGWTGVLGDALCKGRNDWDRKKSRMKVVVPRSCLGKPARVRVNLVTSNDYPGTPVDHAPGKRRYSRWVVAG
ncbi:hypothetical protein QWY28_20525 [Nocardioides sp. SOB77]|uniref:Secreted protein n=1 Tax=Nocardioides oceani TaxID=3058369 RepID=A0ABT8FL09_9ACTN|nr:hypothetical protein [Nocardioides oceani]MDN4175363.1 hypothetical protein [Nocardioides oceani]